MAIRIASGYRTDIKSLGIQRREDIKGISRIGLKPLTRRTPQGEVVGICIPFKQSSERITVYTDNTFFYGTGTNLQ